MYTRTTALKKASSSFQVSIRQDLNRSLTSKSCNGSSQPNPKPLTAECSSGGRTRAASSPHSPFASLSQAQSQKKSNDREFLVSVLETAVTKRDARAYMNKFVPLLERKGATSFKQKASQSIDAKHQDVSAGKTSPSDENDGAVEQASGTKTAEASTAELPYVALVKFRAPHEVDGTIMFGVGRTLSQLKKLGLTSIVVVESNTEIENEAQRRRAVIAQAGRIATAIDSYDGADARVIDSPITIGSAASTNISHFTSDALFVIDTKDLAEALQEELIPIIPSIGFTEDTCAFKTVNANEAVLALARKLSGLQFRDQSHDHNSTTQNEKFAEIYRLIILDPVGGTPARNRATGRYMFLNLEQEYDEVKRNLDESGSANAGTTNNVLENSHHLENATLAKKTLSLLPPTSSAVITTPEEVASERNIDEDDLELTYVGTRRKLNPLIHNLLTDKPVQSSSLPSGRFKPVISSVGTSRLGSLTTLAKRGMPLTILPDPRITPWIAPRPGESRLSLRDPSVDLPRLVHLIDDSFGRKLDVDEYLKRVEGNLAGIIIAGEYEGGAILTWERPHGHDELSTSEPSRLVPYLDKFAVLRKSQGAGGVADIVFNAMVRDCFPEGVCWRSRKDNPVNKWYFERSKGSLKLEGMNWTMFWTTPDLVLFDEKFQDYESVCRGVEPSWADKKHILD